jgi:predicted TIM-barrel fold metal-dependent hydrolase
MSRNAQMIDIHPHIIAADSVRYPRDPLGGRPSAWGQAPLECERLLAAMDVAGIERAVVVNASSVYGFDNSYVSDSAAAHPDRIAAVGSIDLLAENGPERASYWVRERGLIGLRVYAAGTQLADRSASWIADPKAFPVWERMGELGVPVCILLRFGGVPHLIAVLDRFPQVRIILDHFAHPPPEDDPASAGMQTLRELARRPNLFLKLSAPVLRDFDEAHRPFRPFFERVLEAFGSGRIAWGSNFPASPGTLSALLERVKAELAFLPECDREAIFAGTALRLYPALAKASV